MLLGVVMKEEDTQAWVSFAEQASWHCQKDAWLLRCRGEDMKFLAPRNFMEQNKTSMFIGAPFLLVPFFWLHHCRFTWTCRMILRTSWWLILQLSCKVVPGSFEVSTFSLCMIGFDMSSAEISSGVFQRKSKSSVRFPEVMVQIPSICRSRFWKVWGTLQCRFTGLASI